MKVVIVIPAHNEEAVLARNVRALADFLGANGGGDSFSILIAENGSTDRTADVARELARTCDGVECMTSPRSGRGRALKEAWSGRPDADVVGYMDADLSTELEALPEMLAALARGADIVTGSRLLGNSVVKRSFWREVLSQGYNLMTQGILGIGIRDSQCGCKFLWRRHAEALMPLIENDNWFFDTELLARGAWNGLRVVEIPVRWSEKRERKSTVKIIPTVLEEFMGILRLRATRSKRTIR